MAARNAKKRAAYEADPEHWRNVARTWRAKNPEGARMIEQRSKERNWASPWRKLVGAARTRAIQKNVPFNLTFEWAEGRWTGLCEVSGIPFQPRRGANHGIFSPSLDRIVPEKGYTIGNARFVLMGVNGLKIDGTDAEMYFVAEAIFKNKLASERGSL